MDSIGYNSQEENDFQPTFESPTVLQHEDFQRISACPTNQLGVGCSQLPGLQQDPRSNPLFQQHNGRPIHCTDEFSISVRQEATQRLRQYWCLKKQESRRRKREAILDAPHDDMIVVCTKVIKCWQEATKGMTMDTQKNTFQLLLQQASFQCLQPSIEKSILCNIQHSLSQVKTSLSSEELKLKRATCMMMVNSEGQPLRHVNHSQMARFTGLHRRNFSAATSRLKQGNGATFPLELCRRQLTQTRNITKEIKDIVFGFWQTETRVSPNKKDVCRKRLGRKAYIKHPIHLLDESQVELYRRFQTQHPNIKISLRCFEGLKPWFVRRLKDRYTCCCIAHVQMIYLKEALNHMRQSKTGLHGSYCNCVCVICMLDDGQPRCRAAMYSYSSINTLCESLLCAKPNDSVFHKLSCLMGTCQQCGSHRLMLCPKETSENAIQITVKVFKDVASVENAEEGTTKKRKDLVHSQMGCRDFTAFLQRHMSTYIKHNFICRWQSQQFKDCIQKFPRDVVVSVIDFAENYSFKEQNEIQSMHWHSSQVTILVHITYVRDESENISKFIHFYISDDKDHDTLFVQHCLQLHSMWLRDQGFLFLKQHWVWSDGCSAQFKASRPFFFVSRYPSLTGIEMVWSFFASGHGKGEHDGAGAIVKRALTHEQLKPDAWEMKCAKDVVSFLKHKFQDDHQHVGVNRIFWGIDPTEVPREKKWNCKRVNGSRSMHCINGYSQTDKCALRYKTLSCFCEFCMSKRWRRCQNTTHVDSWEYITLVPLEGSDSESVQSSDDEGPDMPIYGGQHDAISDALCIGDTFATNAHEGADFYLLKCSKEKYKTPKALQDAWGNCILQHSFLVEGYYYELADGTEDIYYIPINQPKVLLASHLVRAIKIPMEPLDGEPHKFRLSPEVHENVYNSMPLVL